MDDDKIRKTITLSHRQAIGGASIGAILLVLQPMLDKFQTRSEFQESQKVVQIQVESQADQIRELRASLRDVNTNVTQSKDEVITMLRRLSDAQKQRDAQAEIRQRSTDDRQDQDIREVREVTVLKKLKRQIN